MDGALMCSHGGVAVKCLSAVSAFEWALARVDQPVLSQCRGIREVFVAFIALVWLFSGVRAAVRKQGLGRAQQAFAPLVRTRIGFFVVWAVA
jgi:hypothetical protein